MDGKNSQLFDRAVSALASVFVGNKVGDERLTHHGVMLYNSAIQVFSRMISKKGLPIQEVLSANVVFQLYEVGSSSIYHRTLLTHRRRSFIPPLDSRDGWRTCKVPTP